MNKKIIKFAVFAALGLNFAWSPSRGQYMQSGAKITEASMVNYDQFGHDVALSGDGMTLAAGAPYAGWNTTGDGKVFIYQNSSTGFGASSQQIAESANGTSDTYFGKHLDFSDDGNVLVISAHGYGVMEGVAWVYRKNAAGVYQMEQQLAPTGLIGAGYFSDALDISGDGMTIAIGAPRDDNSIGAVYVYRYQNNAWLPYGNKIVPNNYIFFAEFGCSVSLSYDGNTLAVGGNNDDSYKGAVWIYNYNSAWTQSTKIVTSSGEYVGTVVALDSTGTGVIFADIQLQATGNFWDYRLVNGTWTNTGQVLSNVESMALHKSGSLLVVGMSNSDSAEFAVFKKNNGSWSQVGSNYAGTGASGPSYGGAYSIALSNDANVVAYGNIDDDQDKGAVWTFMQSSPLAIKLKNITAESSENGNLVRWETASEEKGDVFIVEKSDDGSNFRVLSKNMAAKGKPSLYSCRDKYPTEGTNYYRLKMIDGTGAVTWSKTVKLVAAKEQSVAIYPNPAAHEVHITVNGVAPKGQVELTDVLGNTVHRQYMEGNASINLKALPPGVYFIKYRSPDYTITERLLKQ